MKISATIRRSFRRGTITHEASVAIIIATAVIVGTAQVLAIIAHQRRDLDQRSIAAREAGNLLEEIAALPWSDIAEDQLSELALSDECTSVLREPRLEITVSAEPAASGKRIGVAIDWLVAEDQRALPLRLAAWRYPRQESDQ